MPTLMTVEEGECRPVLRPSRPPVAPRTVGLASNKSPRKQDGVAASKVAT